MTKVNTLSKITLTMIISYFTFLTICSIHCQNKKVDELTLKLKTAANVDRVNILNELCWESRLTDMDKGLEYGQEALKLSEKLKLNSGEANAYVNMAYIYIHKSMPNIADNYYKKAINMYENMNNPRKTKTGIARIYEGLGLLAYQEKDYNKAVNYYNRALKIYQELSTHKNISICYRIIGKIYEKAGKKDKANKNYFCELKNNIHSNDKNILSSYNDFEKIGD